MSIFDKLKNTAYQSVSTAVKSAGNKRETFTFAALPESLAELQALPEASLDTPFKTAVLTTRAPSNSISAAATASGFCGNSIC